MKMFKVISSNINAIGWDSDDEKLGYYGTLRIEFSHGGIYNYSNVSYEVASNFLKAESIGKYFHKYINQKYHSVRQN